MTVDVFAICYNEEVMLPHFIKHYKDNFNANITIYDNFSTDRSQQIILDSGCTLKTYDSSGQIRDDLYLGIKNECWKTSKANFVAVVDMDEFLEIPFDVSKCTMVKTQGYDMIGLPPSRMGVKNDLYSKYAFFRPNCLKQIGYQPGAHRCDPSGKIVISEETANLLHYKYTDVNYVYNRHLMYKSRLSMFNRSYGFGIEYQQVEKAKIDNKFAELMATATEII